MPPLAAVATLFVVGTGMLALLLEETSLLPALPRASSNPISPPPATLLYARSLASWR